ncbi:CocE/NonD family hydrolase [Sphingobium fuliginis]|uniref:CocE/NonD family hydrolase n=1 Tax=Sphingobium fuliginis ATCC 27551 TaxID=1208342 RepID=A0A5B8CI51_SPHSA|nr:CocE/NonD family hydrolase [Sphingobium fuliginis]QDC37777.1 CocE/NonD family hydrolase [Sphingobium fuliginis ATCC 27551]
MNETTEIRNGLCVSWNVPIPARDGTILRADIFRPADGGRCPALLSYGPYAKGLAFQDGYPAQWESLIRDYPEVARDTTTELAVWETPDPERWVPFGYAIVRVDSRGAGQSPGMIDPWSTDESKDLYDCIEWAAAQAWCTGRVGLAGVSYYAMNQWTVAAMQPPHLAAICPFEGASDLYRDGIRHGGILSTFLQRWFPVQVLHVQNGLGSRAPISRMTGTGIAGDVDLSDEELSARRVDIAQLVQEAVFENEYTESRTADLSKITVPLLSCGNWGGQGMHLRGNVEGFLGAGSNQKWLELHGREHWTEFYTDYGVALQRQFFDHFLKGADNGWDKRPPVLLQVRHVDGFVEREEAEWPIARTRWTDFHLDASRLSLSRTALDTEASIGFQALSESVTFWSDPFEEDTEITGPLAAKLFAASTTTDADIFLALRLYDPDRKEVLFVGATDPNCPLSLGWLRASHRKLDAQRSLPYRPFHPHDRAEPLEPGARYELDIEIWPTSIVVPKGFMVAVTISGTDYHHDLPEPWPQVYGVPLRGVSVMTHDDPVDRPAAIFGGVTTIFTGGASRSAIAVPIVPPKGER